ncbi:MAG TPA: GAF and ANTAR domain-containing protein [Acidimicrobiales bacterium]|nr:GAF and ANTAR domain-containing protein [Acidimicrobiales bacterium]
MTRHDPKRSWAVLSGVADHEPPSLETLCRGCVALLPVSGAAISLMAPAHSQSVASAFDGRARAVQDLEFTLGEGPAMDAYAQGLPVLVPDVRFRASRWPQFCAAVAAMGVEAVFALPLVTTAANIGVLVLYRDEAGALDDHELGAALEVADLVTQLVLVMQSEAASESVAWALGGSDHRAVVHQATGMIAVQIDSDVEEALVRLRAHSFAADRPIREVAEDVVTGDLRFDDQ